MQTRLDSLIEALLNTFIGFVIQFFAAAVFLHLLGISITMKENFILGLGMTIVSVIRGYCVRRWAQKYLTRTKLWIYNLFVKENINARLD